jgi:hypothetical protein
VPGVYGKPDQRIGERIDFDVRLGFGCARGRTRDGNRERNDGGP